MQLQPDDKPVRPQLLTILCVLTFFGSGLSFIANGIMFLTIDSWKVAYENGVFEVFENQLEMDALELMLNVNPLFYLAQSIGAWFMWNLNKQGFHVYAIAQILLLIIYKVFLVSAPFPVLPLVVTITFIFLYYRNLQFMR